MASRFATTRMLITRAAMTGMFTTATGTTPRWPAKASQIVRPRTIPSGTPTAVPNEGDRRGLPRHRSDDLSVHKSEYPQKGRNATSTGHADDQEMDQGGGSERRHNPCHYEREVHRFSEVDQ